MAVIQEKDTHLLHKLQTIGWVSSICLEFSTPSFLLPITPLSQLLLSRLLIFFPLGGGFPPFFIFIFFWHWGLFGLYFGSEGK